MFADLLFHFCWCVSSSTFQAEITCWNLLSPGFRNRAAEHSYLHVLSCPVFSLDRILIYEGSLFQSCFHHVNVRYLHLTFALKSERSRAWQSASRAIASIFPSKLKVRTISNEKVQRCRIHARVFTPADEKAWSMCHISYLCHTHDMN